MNRSIFKRMATAFLIAAVALAGCEEDTVKVTGVSLNEQTLTLAVGDTRSLEETVEPADAANKAVTWTVTGDAVTVDDGTVTAVKAGDATVTVTTADGGKTASCTVKVNEKSAITVADGDRESLVQTVFADETAGKSAVKFTTVGAWTSAIAYGTAKAAIVKADGETGWLSISPDHGEAAGAYTIAISMEPNPTGEDRSATITITCNGMDIEISVTQKGTKADGTAPVSGVTLDKTELTLEVGKTETLIATVVPDDAGDKTVTWTSSDEKVAAVSDAGVVSAVSQGKATITATTKEGGKTAICAVNVVAAIQTVPVSELVAQIERFHDQLHEAWLQIDGDYSTYTSRLQLTQDSPFLLDFWGKAYKCIRNWNSLLEYLDTDMALPESEKAGYRGKAYAGRATAYFYLKTLWGGVPLVTKTLSIGDAFDIPRSSVQDVVKLIYADMDHANILSARPFTSIYGLLSEIIPIQENDGVMQAMVALRAMIESGDVYFSADMQDDNTKAMLAHLLLAEASLKTGNSVEAAQYINIINAAYGLPLILPTDDIHAMINQKYQALTNTGMKFLNAVRWGETEIWGYRELMPIPLRELNLNRLLEQNPGW